MTCTPAWHSQESVLAPQKDGRGIVPVGCDFKLAYGRSLVVIH